MAARVIMLVFSVMLLAACGGDEDVATESAAEPSTSSVSEPTTTVTAGIPVEDRVVCGQALEGGFARIECEEMSFEIGVPEECLEGSCGLIVDVHPRGQNTIVEEQGTSLRRLGTDAGFVVVQPESPASWWDMPVDSVNIRSFLDNLIEALDIDWDRVHFGGASQGGLMTWLFVCDHSDLIATAAPLASPASNRLGLSCNNERLRSAVEQVDILMVHGWTDSIVPFNTAVAQRNLLVSAWDMTEAEVLADEASHRWTRWTNDEGTVFEFIEFDGGHCFPGVDAPDWGCSADDPIHYGQAALEFHAAHPKDE